MEQNIDLFSGFDFEKGLLKEPIEKFAEKLSVVFSEKEYSTFKSQVCNLFEVDQSIYDKIDDNTTINKIFLLEIKIFRKTIVNLVQNASPLQQEILNKFLKLVNSNLQKVNTILESDKNYQMGGKDANALVQMPSLNIGYTRDTFIKDLGVSNPKPEIIIELNQVKKTNPNKNQIIQVPTQTQDIDIVSTQTQNIDIVPTQTKKIVPTQTQNIDIVPTQTKGIDIVPTQTQDIDIVPTQTQDIVPTQTQDIVPIQTQDIVPTQTQDIDIVPTQTKYIVPTQIQYIVPTQTKDIIPIQTMRKIMVSEWVNHVDQIFESDNLEKSIGYFITDTFKSNGFKLVKKDKILIDQIVKQMCKNLSTINQAKTNLEQYNRKYKTLGLDKSIKSINSLKKTSVLLLTKTFLDKYLDLMINVVDHKIDSLEKLIMGGERSNKYLKYKIKYLINKNFV